jgi:hypothetical protein
LQKQGRADRRIRPEMHSGRITPPFPSPPIGAPSSRIRTATFTSPTGVRIACTPASRATFSTIWLLDRFVTTGPAVPQHQTSGEREGVLLADRPPLVTDDRQPVDVRIHRQPMSARSP